MRRAFRRADEKRLFEEREKLGEEEPGKIGASCLATRAGTSNNVLGVAAPPDWLSR